MSSKPRLTPVKNRPWATSSLRSSSDVLRSYPDEGDNEGMSTSITREEFQAELRAMRSDMAASQAELRAIFAESQRDILKAVGVVAESVAEIRGEVAGVRGEAEGVRGILSGEIKGLHGEIAGVKSALTTTQWTVGIVVGLAAVLVAGVQLFVAYKVPQTPAQPAVIYVQPAVSAQPATVSPAAPPPE